MASAQSTLSKLLGQLDYPMLIVTGAAGDARAGCLVGFWTQTSIEPVRLLVCISRQNRTYRVIGEAASILAVHFLEPGNRALAELFGAQTGDEIDKFARCAWHAGPGDAPILDDCASWAVGRIDARLELGDHAGFLLEPIAAQHAGARDWLGFQQIGDLEAGHEAGGRSVVQPGAFER